MIRIIIFTITFFTALIVSAQEQEGKFQEEAAKKIRAEFPRARVLNFEYGSSFSRDFDSRLFDEEFQTGKIKDQKTFRASANIPLYKTQKWSLTGSADYVFNEFEFSELRNISSQTTYNQNKIADFHKFSAALSSTYFSILFKKPVIYNASLIVDGNDKGAQRLKGFLGASLIMKRTARTTITLGAIAFIDPTSQIPFFPTFTYTHQFKNSEWEVDFILPQRLLLRRPVGQNGRLSIGSTFGSSGFYVNVNAPDFPDVFEYSQLEINSGLIYEHKLTHNIILTAKGGLTNFISSRLTEKGKPNKDYIYRNEQGATGYFNAGVSFDPFTKKR